MKELFTDQTVVINAQVEDVWRVITDKTHTPKWAQEFTNGAPFRIESGWQLSSPVLWKDESGKTIVEGTVTALDKPHLLRFTVFAANTSHATTTNEDGITWTLRAKQNATILRVRQGNFASVEGGEENYKQTELIWARILPIVKVLAEKL
jgi:uncharacterized protein YndB with AHSA1/START domain